MEHPEEFSMFIEYSLRLRTELLSDDFDYFEAAWLGFERYSFHRSQELLGQKSASIINAIRGPMNALGFIPGTGGVLADVYGNQQMINEVQIKGMLDRIYTIRRDGPQFFNKSLFKQTFGREPDSALQKVFRNVQSPVGDIFEWSDFY